MSHTLALVSALAPYVGQYPMPVQQIARDAGWHVRYWADMGRALGIVVMGAPLVCLIAEQLGESQRRYVLAHEMGHVLCGHESLVSLCWDAHESGEIGPWLQRRQEREADVAAALLLMPAAVVLKSDTVSELAAACDVPLWLAQVRMTIEE